MMDDALAFLVYALGIFGIPTLCVLAVLWALHRWHS